jgi:hypothetical protein
MTFRKGRKISLPRICYQHAQIPDRLRPRLDHVVSPSRFCSLAVTLCQSLKDSPVLLFAPAAKVRVDDRADAKVVHAALPDILGQPLQDTVATTPKC